MGFRPSTFGANLRFMNFFAPYLNRAAAAIAVVVCLSFGAVAGEAELDALFERLQSPELPEWQEVEQAIWAEWSKSGSDAMDVLLERGRSALAQGDYRAAIEHLTALTDHAPEFAEGWNARATAYFRAGLYGPSISDIERTLALNPRHFGAMSGLATILAQLGFEAEALDILRKAAAVHPHRPDLKDNIERLSTRIDGTDL
jgi:tetratricopeptide (TPR) repeat protein